MRSCRVKKVVLVLTTAFIVLSGVVLAQESSGPPSQRRTDPVEVVKTNGEIRVKLNFQDAPLQTVLEYLSETAGLTIISDETLLTAG